MKKKRRRRKKKEEKRKSLDDEDDSVVEDEGYPERLAEAERQPRCQNWIGEIRVEPAAVVTTERRRDTRVWVGTENNHVARTRYHEGGEHLVSPAP